MSTQLNNEHEEEGQWRCGVPRAKSQHSLKELRAQIDHLDRQIAELLHLRLKLVEDVGGIKAKRLLSVYDRDREKSVLAKVEDAINDENLRPHVRRIYVTIMQESRRLQGLEDIPG